MHVCTSRFPQKSFLEKNRSSSTISEFKLNAELYTLFTYKPDKEYGKLIEMEMGIDYQL